MAASQVAVAVAIALTEVYWIAMVAAVQMDKRQAPRLETAAVCCLVEADGRSLPLGLFDQVSLWDVSASSVAAVRRIRCREHSVGGVDLVRHAGSLLQELHSQHRTSRGAVDLAVDVHQVKIVQDPAAHSYRQEDLRVFCHHRSLRPRRTKLWQVFVVDGLVPRMGGHTDHWAVLGRISRG